MVVTALAGCCYVFTMQPDDAPRPRPRGLVGEPRIAAQLPTTITAAQCLKGGDPALQRLLRERGDQWLGHERSAEGLIALWDLTHDPALLAEAAEKFPDDPRVCMAMIQEAISSPLDPMPWIERLLAAEPAIAERHLLKAWALSIPNPAGALAALRAFNDIILTGITPGLDNSRQVRMVALGDAAAACGLSIRESALLVLGRSREDRLRREMMSSVATILHAEMDAQLAGAKVESATELAHLGLTMHTTLMLSGTGLLGDAFAANDLMLSVLVLLPDETRLLDYPYTPTAGELAYQAMTEFHELGDFRNVVSRHEEALLAAATDEVVALYASHFFEIGEAAARRASSWRETTLRKSPSSWNSVMA